MACSSKQTFRIIEGMQMIRKDQDENRNPYMFSNKDHTKIKLTTDWRLTIFGQPIHTPKDMLPINHKDSPHYERWKKENKK